MKYAVLNLKRVVKRKSNYISFIVFLVLIALLNYLVFRTFNFSKLDLSAYDLVPMILSNYFSIRASGIVSLFIALFVLSDEYKEGVYQRPVEAGYSRTNIVISNFIITVILSIAFLIVTYIVHCLSILILYGNFEKENFELILMMLKYIALNIPQIFVFIMIPFIIYNIVKTDFLASLLSYVTCIFLKKFLNLIGGYLNLPWILKITQFAPSTTNIKISSLFMDDLIGKSISYDFANEFVTNMDSLPSTSIQEIIPAIGISALIFVVLLAIDILIFNKKDFA